MLSKRIVIIPTFNEKENIERVLKAVLMLPISFDILVVDDSSPDGTAFLVEEIQKKNPSIFLEIRKTKDGLGKAYVHGFKWALAHNYDYIFEMDADFSHNPEDLPRLLHACETDADIAIGSRYCKGVNVVNWPMGRVLMSYFASKYVRFVTGLPIHDATAGFIGYRKIVLEQIDLDKVGFSGYAFQIEMKYRAWTKKFRLKEIPIIFTDRTLGESKISGSIVKEAIFGVVGLRLKKIFRQL